MSERVIAPPPDIPPDGPANISPDGPVPVDRAVWQAHFDAMPPAERVTLPAGERQSPAMVAQERKIERRLPSILKRIQPNIRRGVEERYIPPEAVERIETAFLSTPVRVVGGLAAESEIGRDEVKGEYHPDQNAVFLAPDLGRREVADVAIHEIGGHQASGGTFKRDPETGQPVRTRVGLRNVRELNLSSTFEEYATIDEAVEEHLGQAYKDGKFGELDPDKHKRWGVPQRYYARRKVLADAIAKAGGVIDLRVVTRAAFEDTNEPEAAGTTMTDRREMMRQFSHAYGPGSLRELIRFIDVAEANCGDTDAARRENRELLRRQLACITPPVLGEAGEVVTPGAFDIDRAVELGVDAELFIPGQNLDRR